MGKGDKTKDAVALVIKNFLACTDAKDVREVNDGHVRQYWQYEINHSPTKSRRTAHNRTTFLLAFLKAHGVVIKWKIPPFDQTLPEVYEPEESEALLAACDAKHRAAYSVMYKALFRDREVVYLTWDCVDVKRNILRVRSKPEYNWRVKKYRERDVTVPKDLIDQITALPRTSKLVLPREDGNPDGHLLRALKDTAKKAGVDPKRAKLHSWRRSGATHLLQKGLPLQEVMALGGWKDLKSVQRYAGLLSHERRQKAVEAAWA